MKTHECNHERIHEFLNGAADQPGAVLTEQLEECPQCRAYFNSQVASDDEWSQVGQLLQPGEHDRATRIDFSAGSNAGQQARQSVCINDVLESLTPTDDPHSLGRVGNYEVKGVVGAGGMGVVLKAFEPSLDRVVAIKVLAPHLANNDKARQRFEREARAAAAVIDPNVIPIYSVTSDGKLPYLVMACIQGGSLQQRLDNQGAASVPEVLRIGSQIASGLAAAHEQGLVHRDIKPENILFEGDVERVSITDFGLARAVDDNTVTQAGTIAGTPMYMSPEQARGEEVDQQSDLFSLGSVLYALCTGQPPYCADSSLGVMRKITDETPTPVCELNPETPGWLSDIIEKLMARNKADRFTSAAEVRDLLESCLSHVQAPENVPLPAQVQTTSRREKPPIRRRTAIGLGGMLLGLVAAVFFIVTNNGVVKVEVMDESFQVAIDGKTLTVTEEGNIQPIELRVGDHKLTVKIGETEFVTSDFEIRRNDEVAFRVEHLKGKVVLSRNGMQVASRSMPGSSVLAKSQSEGSDPQVAKASTKAAAKTLADLPGSDLAIIYKLLTRAELGGNYVSDKPNPGLARDVSVLLGFKNVSRERIAKSLVELGKPAIAKIVLSDGRVDGAVTEALKLGDLLVSSGNRTKAADAYLEAFRLAPQVFQGEYVEIFDEQNRMKDLVDLFTEERLSQTRSVSDQLPLLMRLMKDDLRTSLGMTYMTRAWNGRPDMRTWILDEVPWKEVPDRAGYFADVLIPKEVEKIGKGWRQMFIDSGIQGGHLHDMRSIIDAEAAQQLTARMRPLVEKHPDWSAGSATLVALEAIAGDYEPAKQWIEDNQRTVTGYTQGSDYDQFLGSYAGYFGKVLGGRDQELDRQVIKLYEQSLKHYESFYLYRKSCVNELAKLYRKVGRNQDAIDLMFGLVERERKAEEYRSNTFGSLGQVNLDQERIWDLREAVYTLNGFGRPMDALSLMSRIDFDQRRAAGVYKGGGYTYDDKDLDNDTTESQKLVTPNTIVEALNRGVLPLGLASTIDKETGEIKNPIVELLGQVARGELDDEVTAAFESVNAKLSDANAMDRHLNDLMKQRPNDTDVAAAAILFAFLQDDIEAAKQRLEVLDSISGTDHKARAADVNLHLVAEHAVKHEETAEIGQRLAERVAQAGEQMNDEWKQFFQYKTSAAARQDSQQASSGNQPRSLKVFILAGQSNMVGHGKVEFGRNPDYKQGAEDTPREIKGGIGGLRHMATDPATSEKFGHLLTSEDDWVERDDVFVYSTAPGKDKGQLSVGFGKQDWFGPELGFGNVVGDHFDEPVLIIKTAWGGKDLAVDFRPPSSGETELAKDREAGAFYKQMMKVIRYRLTTFDVDFPELKGCTPEIVGFGWHQGWNDGCSAEMTAEYEENMANFINDVRKELGVADLPFVIANTGQNGADTKGTFETLCEKQMNIGDANKHPEFKGTVTSIDTRPFKAPEERSPSGFGYHWNHSGETHYRVGDSMGQAMVKLLQHSKSAQNKALSP